jgi:hypothetical protein
MIELTAEWTLMGRRQEGKHNYDESFYGQRWELHQQIAKIRNFSRLVLLMKIDAKWPSNSPSRGWLVWNHLAQKVGLLRKLA